MESDSLGAGAGAGVIVTNTSGLAIKIASVDIKAKPGNGPESGTVRVCGEVQHSRVWGDSASPIVVRGRGSVI